jgi:hypothetical protein
MASNSLIAFVGGLIVVVTIAFIFPPSGGWRKFPIKPTGILPQNYIAKPWLSREPGRLAAPYRLSRAEPPGDSSCHRESVMLIGVSHRSL